MEIIIWIACTILCAVLADKQGRSVVLGAVLGLLFGVFALIGYLIAGSAAKCNSCRKSVHPEATICPHCRTPIDA
jgi:hypothetical protein